jgi:hypothetical protein
MIGAMRAISPRSRLLAHLGAGLGFVGWVIGLGVVLALGGDGAAALRLLPPAALLSVGLWLCSVIVVEGTRRAFGDAALELRLALFGFLLLAIGILAIALQHWILPEVLASARGRDALARTGSVTEVPFAWRIPPLAAGVLLLARPAFRLARGTADAGPPAQDQS